MKKKGKAPTSAATLTGARVEAVHGEVVASAPDFITARQLGQVERLLQHGEENALRTSELVSLLGVQSPRELRTLIARERESGALILSSCRGGGGYFLPADGARRKEELLAFIRTLSARASSTFAVLRTAKAALEEIEGQTSLDL